MMKMEPLVNVAKENPQVVTQVVAAVISMLASFGVVTLAPEGVAELATEVTAVIFGVGQIVAGFVGQRYTVPAYRAAEYDGGEG